MKKTCLLLICSIIVLLSFAQEIDKPLNQTHQKYLKTFAAMIRYLKVHPAIDGMSSDDTAAFTKLQHFPAYDTVINWFFTGELRAGIHGGTLKNAEIGLAFSKIGLSVMDEYLDYLPWDSLHIGNDPHNRYLLEETTYPGVVLNIYYKYGQRKIQLFYIAFNKKSGKIFNLFAHTEQNKNLLHWLNFCAKYRPEINKQIEKLRPTGIFDRLPENEKRYKKRKTMPVGEDKIESKQ